MMANHRHRRPPPPPPAPPQSAVAHHCPLRLEMQPANVHRGKDGMENDNPQQQQQRPKTVATTTTTSGKNRSSSLRRLTGRRGGTDTSSRRRAKSVSTTTAATTTTSSKMSTARGKSETLIAGNSNSTTAGGTITTSSTTGMVVAIPEPLSFEEFKELRRRRRHSSHGVGGGQQQQPQHRTATTTVTSGRIVVEGGGSNNIPRSTSQASRVEKSAPLVEVIAGVATVVDVEEDDDYEDEFTSMIQSLHIDVLNTSTNNNKNNELIKTNERAKMMKARRRVEDMRRRRSSRVDVGLNEINEENNITDRKKEEEDRNANRIVLVPQDNDADEIEVVVEDPVQCAFDIFRNDVRAARALQDVFAPALSTTAGAKITVSTQAGGGSGNVVEAIGTVLQEEKLEPDEDDNMEEEEEEDPEKELERQQRRLRQSEDLSGMVLVIPENWEEVAGFITPNPKSSSSKSSVAVVTTAEKQLAPSSNGGLKKSASTDCGDGNSTIVTKKKDDHGKKQHDVDSTRTLSSTPNMIVRNEVLATTAAKKKGRTSTTTTGRLPPLRGVSLGGGGGSMRKKLSSATRRMRRSSSGGASQSSNVVTEVVPLDDKDRTVKKCKQPPQSSTFMTTKTGDMNETNVSKKPQATRIQKVAPAVNAAPDDELGSYNIAQHFMCDNRRNDDGESSDTMRIHIMDVLPGEGEDVLTPMERDWNSSDRLPDIFRCHDTRDDEKRIVDCSEEKEKALPQERTCNAINKPESASDDNTKDTSTTSSPTHPNSEETTSHPSCETNASSHHLRDNNNKSINGGLVKSRISQIQQRIEVLSAASLTSDDRISPLSATSIADGRRKDNNCFIRTVPIGIAKSNMRECLASSTGDGNVKTGSLSYTYSC